jgi:hypothetical protein
MDTHAFNDPQDPANGGTWYDDYGRHICIWYWDADTKMVTVIRGTRGKHVNLSGIGEQLLTPEALREKLPRVAFEIAQRIIKEG